MSQTGKAVGEDNTGGELCRSFSGEFAWLLHPSLHRSGASLLRAMAVARELCSGAQDRQGDVAARSVS